MIISASRRTDIPGFYSDWFMNRLQEGFVLTRNPMNHNQISKINLKPEYVDCIVLWTKDPGPMLDKLKILKDLGYPYYFQFTLTPYGRDYERNIRDKEDILQTFIKLSDRIGKEKVLWRYDPIILNEDLTPAYHLEKFRFLCSRLYGYTNVCTISFVDVYTKLTARVKENMVKEISEKDMEQLSLAFSEIGRKYNIKVKACCEKADLTRFGVEPASCIDQALIERICGYSLDLKADKNQRKGCGCIQSVDIGAYNTCRNGCIYCYANQSLDSAENNYKKHEEHSPILTGTVEEWEKVTERKAAPRKKLREGVEYYKQEKFDFL